MVSVFKAKAKKLSEGFQIETESRGFKILLDEPKDLGGTNQGMNPVEAILCAFGACQTIVAFSFAKKQGVELEDFQVELEGDLDPDGFLGLSDVRPGFSEIRYCMHIKSSSPEDKILQFVDHIEKFCPVGDILENEVKLVRSDVIIKK